MDTCTHVCMHTYVNLKRKFKIIYGGRKIHFEPPYNPDVAILYLNKTIITKNQDFQPYSELYPTGCWALVSSKVKMLLTLSKRSQEESKAHLSHWFYITV